jgi:2-polyprenyl-6-methoxyphenol hydroxylase-like FAD-dependent oxidoreductase
MKTIQDMNILIIGAGIAGLTCAALLKKQGANVTVIEKLPKEFYNSTGYMLGLLPLGGRVINALGLKEEYFKNSIEMKNYEIHKADGQLIKRYSLDFINEAFGSYRGISRVELVDLLLKRVDSDKIRYGLKIKEFLQEDETVLVTFEDGQKEIFDLVVGADGMHSQTRKMILQKDEYAYYETHWGGWVAWLEGRDDHVYREYWGVDSFMGFYPVKDKVGIFVSGSLKTIEERGLQGCIDEVKKTLDPNSLALLEEALDRLARESEPYFWDLHDCKSEKWSKGNIILLGDAADGFLPTAGIGASMAMDSAAALVDELSRAETGHLDYAIKLYTDRQKERVEIAQKDSRRLGKIMFVSSPLVADMRDFSLRFYTLKNLVSNITKMIQGKN